MITDDIICNRCKILKISSESERTAFTFSKNQRKHKITNAVRSQSHIQNLKGIRYEQIERVN